MEFPLPDTDPSSRLPAVTRPSLMGAAETPTPSRVHATTDAGRMRMLDELEAVVGPRIVKRSSAPSNGLVALLAVGVMIGGLLWWTRHRGPEVAAPVVATVERAVAEPAKALAAPVPSAIAASVPAVIEIATPAEVAVAEGADAAAVNAPAPPAAVAPAPVARAAVRPAMTRTGSTSRPAPGAKVTTVTTASGGKWTVTVSDAPTAQATNADKVLPSPASAVASPGSARGATKGDDADVRLLSALLAHVSRPSSGAALADEDQMTIAQVVKRCNARPAAEVRECRRRICEGYWGKAEACPAALAKKG